LKPEGILNIKNNLSKLRNKPEIVKNVKIKLMEKRVSIYIIQKVQKIIVPIQKILIVLSNIE